MRITGYPGSSLISSWYTKDDPMSKARWCLLRAQYCSNTIRAMINGTFWTGLLLILNADDAFIGTLGMISTACGMLQFLGPLFLERFKKRKTMLMWLRAVMWLINVLLVGLIPLAPVGQQAKLYLLIVCMLSANLINIVVSPGVCIWHLQCTPENVRGGYFSLFTMTSGAVVALFTFLGGLVVDAFKAGGMEYWGLLTLRIFAALLCAAELILYRRIPEYEYPQSGKSFSMKGLLRNIVKHRIYLLTMLVGFVWSFSAGIPGSYYSVYLLKDVGLSYKFLSLVGALNVPVVLFLTPVWKKVLSKYGWLRTMYIGVALKSIDYAAQSLVSPANHLWLFPISQLTAYFFSISITLTSNGVPYLNIPEENRTAFYGMYESTVYLASFLGVALGKRIVLTMGEKVIPLLGMQFCAKQAVMLISAALMLCSVAVIRSVYGRIRRAGQSV